MNAPTNLPVYPAPPPTTEPTAGTLRERIWRTVFHSDRPAGRVFDVVLLWLIGISVLVVALESVESLRTAYGQVFRIVEWAFTIVFTIEYLVRLWVVRRPLRYATSFFGIVDLLAFAPTYLELFVAGSHYMMILRVLRLLRMFRVLKMAHHISEAGVLMNALMASRAKISVFLFSVLALVCVEGTVMYLIEHPGNPSFANIPTSIYWAIVTITTVGYGDVTPITVLGKMMASIVMLTGFAILAVPTGIVSAELGREISRQRRAGFRCPKCGWDEHETRARHCHQCGLQLPAPPAGN
ncbi:MAG: ion transporter [Verrucomicrobia bacterium]|nr:ion transporter [Verrucomicrobiota bacterium]